KHEMPWFIIPILLVTALLIISTMRRAYKHKRTPQVVALGLVLGIGVLASLTLKTDATPLPNLTPGSSGAHPEASSDAGIPGPIDPGCSDPKTCGEPRPPIGPGDAGPIDPGCS